MLQFTPFFVKILNSYFRRQYIQYSIWYGSTNVIDFDYDIWDKNIPICGWIIGRQMLTPMPLY